MDYDQGARPPGGPGGLFMKRLLARSLPSAAAGARRVRAQAPAKADAVPVREFKSVNIEVKGNKIWTPSTFIVKKGDKVKITLINTASAIHAFAIDGYDVNVQVNNAENDNTKVVEFTADKAGLFRIYCS